ncbi:LysE family transporter [[Haemophilus] felis]|nr:LysE family transporter [[Haemophilus] felis]
MLNIFSIGFLTSMTLLLSIGAQNTFVLQQGIKREYVFVVATVFFLCDIILMSFGVFGVGKIINDNAIFLTLITLLGAAFLLWYGFNSLKSAWKGNSQLLAGKSDKKSNWKQAAAGAFAVSLLNPNVLLDTLAIIGGISVNIAADLRIFYLIGALLASALWFYSIGYLAFALAKYLANKTTWRIIETLIGIYMWYIAAMLLRYAHQNGLFSFL